jgi:hypothetical protein
VELKIHYPKLLIYDIKRYSIHAPRSVKAFLKRADRADVKAPVASRRSKMVIKVIKVVVNKITSFQ